MARTRTAAPAKRDKRDETRYARVKAILDAAAAGSTADYGGVGRFWDGDLAELVKVCVHGVRMIAPVAEASCCGAGGDKTVSGQCVLDPNSPESWHPCSTVSQPYRIWWDVFPIPSGRQISVFGRNVIVPGYFKMRSRFVDYPGLFVVHCHILAHEDRGMMTVVEVRPRALPYAHH